MTLRAIVQSPPRSAVDAGRHDIDLVSFISPELIAANQFAPRSSFLAYSRRTAANDLRR